MRHWAGRIGFWGWAVLLASSLLGCTTPRLQESGGTLGAPRLGDTEAIMEDGYRLPLHLWEPPGAVAAVAVGLHGFNDYHNAFADVGPFLARRGIALLAYDQRGFGSSEQRGIWPGSDRLVSDLRTLVGLLGGRYPDVPLYVIGESMGGAVALVMLTQHGAPPIEGLVLIAPAVWGRAQMNPVQQGVLWLLAHTLPGLEVTGRGLGIRPSDNREMLGRFSRDPLVIKDTRIDALWGVTLLMDEALASGARLQAPTLLLYGEQDQIIPKRSFCGFAEGLPRYPGGPWRIALYPQGYHMLTRDLQAQAVLQDIGSWVLNPGQDLPSGAELPAGGEPLDPLCAAGRG